MLEYMFILIFLKTAFSVSEYQLAWSDFVKLLDKIDFLYVKIRAKLWCYDHKKVEIFFRIKNSWFIQLNFHIFYREKKHKRRLKRPQNCNKMEWIKLYDSLVWLIFIIYNISFSFSRTCIIGSNKPKTLNLLNFKFWLLKNQTVLEPLIYRTKITILLRRENL